jgi:hypothetical protein
MQFGIKVAYIVRTVCKQTHYHTRMRQSMFWSTSVRMQEAADQLCTARSTIGDQGKKG